MEQRIIGIGTQRASLSDMRVCSNTAADITIITTTKQQQQQQQQRIRKRDLLTDAEADETEMAKKALASRAEAIFSFMLMCC
jgi:hypothetical protein